MRIGCVVSLDGLSRGAALDQAKREAVENPSNAVRVRAKAVGDLALGSETLAADR